MNEYVAYVTGLVERTLSVRDQVRVLVQNLIKDTTLPLEDRWAMFIAAKDLLPIESYCDFQVSELGPDIVVYDHFYTEKYQTRMYEDLWEMVQRQEDPENGSFYVPGWNVTAWQEAILKAGYAGGVYDW